MVAEKRGRAGLIAALEDAAYKIYDADLALCFILLQRDDGQDLAATATYLLEALERAVDLLARDVATAAAEDAAHNRRLHAFVGPLMAEKAKLVERLAAEFAKLGAEGVAAARRAD